MMSNSFVKSMFEDETSRAESIKLMLNQANGSGDLDELVFYFISATSFYVGPGDIFPAELAMAKFSLRRGIFDDVQIRINPGTLPMGSAFAAQEKSKKGHKYPLPPRCEGEQDYMAVLETMLKFLHPMESIPILFTDEQSSLEETCAIVSKIFYESEEEDALSQIKIFPLADLLFNLRIAIVTNYNRLNDPKISSYPSVVYARTVCRGGRFTCLASGCDFHNDEGAVDHCALARARVSGYILSQGCSDGHKYELVEGRHFPMGFQSNNSY